MLNKKVRELQIIKGTQLDLIDFNKKDTIKELNMLIDITVENISGETISDINYKTILHKCFDKYRIDRNSETVIAKRDMLTTLLKEEYELGNIYVSDKDNFSILNGTEKNLKISIPVNFSLNSKHTLSKYAGIEPNANSLQMRIDTLSPADLDFTGKITISTSVTDKKPKMTAENPYLLNNSEISETKAILSTETRYDLPTGAPVRNIALFFNNSGVGTDTLVKKINLWVNDDMVAEYDYNTLVADTINRSVSQNRGTGFVVIDFDSYHNANSLLDLSKVRNGDAYLQFETNVPSSGDVVIVSTEKIEKLKKI